MTELESAGITPAAPLPEVAAGPTPGTAPEKRKGAVRAWQGVIVLILLAFVLMLAWQLWRNQTTEKRASGAAPPFTFTTFEGETISLADLKGKGVVLNFWASWCGPCRDEAVLLEETWRREKENGIVFIGLDYLDQEPAAKDYLAEFDITYPSGPDLQSSAARRYGISGVPETFLIDPQGNIVDFVIGPDCQPGQNG